LLSSANADMNVLRFFYNIYKLFDENKNVHGFQRGTKTATYELWASKERGTGAKSP